jgi:hypothetical protein
MGYDTRLIGGSRGLQGQSVLRWVVLTIVEELVRGAWRRSTCEREQWYLESPALDVKPNSVLAPYKAESAKPVRKQF